MRMLKRIVNNTIYGLFILVVLTAIVAIGYAIFKIILVITFNGYLLMMGVLILAYLIGEGLDWYTKRTL